MSKKENLWESNQPLTGARISPKGGMKGNTPLFPVMTATKKKNRIWEKTDQVSHL